MSQSYSIYLHENAFRFFAWHLIAFHKLFIECSYSFLLALLQLLRSDAESALSHSSVQFNPDIYWIEWIIWQVKLLSFFSKKSFELKIYHQQSQNWDIKWPNSETRVKVIQIWSFIMTNAPIGYSNKIKYCAKLNNVCDEIERNGIQHNVSWTQYS